MSATWEISRSVWDEWEGLGLGVGASGICFARQFPPRSLAMVVVPRLLPVRIKV